MANFCIAIGVDGYANPAWQLNSCVDDAIAFADWAVSSGGVAPGDLRLFLSPKDRSAPPSVALPRSNEAIPTLPATRKNIFGFIEHEMQGGDARWGAGGGCLYWYFAGHGCSHQDARRARAEPVLFPVDVETLGLTDANNLIGFSDILDALRGCEPAKQLFFLDACRDFALPGYASSAGASGRFFRPPPNNDQQRWATQHVLYATAPGERAAELGCGVFSEFLISGLSGHPGALSRIAGLGDYELSLGRLASFVRSGVEARVRKVSLPSPTRVIQFPELELDPTEQEFIVAEIPNDMVPEVELFVRVRPASAHAAGVVQAYYEKMPVPSPCGPPLKSLNSLWLKPSYYKIKAMAPGMPSIEKTVRVPLEGIVEFDLAASPAATSQLRLLSAKRVASSSAEANYLRFFTKDQNLPIQVWDTENKIHTAINQLKFDHPKAGLYRAMVPTPEGGSIPQGFTFPDCGAEIELKVETTALSDPQLLALARADIRGDTAISLAEFFQNLSEVKAVSLLGFAAYATYVSDYGGKRLRSLGMLPLRPEARTGAWVTVVIVAKGYEPAPGLSVSEFLTRSTIDVPGAGENGERGLHILEGFDTAGQILAACPEGSFSVELRLPGIPVTRYAMVGIPGRIGVLTVAVDDDQTVEVQQYLFSFDPGSLRPEDLPNVERAQRFYAAGRPLPDGIVNRLLMAKQIDPLQACLAGYSLARQRQHGKFVGEFKAGDKSWNPQSALQNMLNFFDVLPDTHVLAGLCEPDRCDVHYRRALERGIPLFSDGFRTLIDYFSKVPIETFSPTARRAMRTLSTGAMFSSWLSREPVISIGSGHFDAPPPYWRLLEEHRTSIEEGIAACGHLAFSTDGERRALGSAFLVGPDLVLTANHTIAPVLAADVAPTVMKPDYKLFFTTATDPLQSESLRVAEVVGVDAAARMALLRLERPILDAAPLSIAPSGFQIAPGLEVYLIGYPHSSPLSDPGLIQHIFRGKHGVKCLQPGVILAAPDTERSFDHDASTLGGSAGSPVIDLASGYVIGVHWGGMEDAGHKRGRASALTVPGNRGLLSALPQGRT